MKLEACIESLQEAQSAAAFNLNRVELCSALDLGGLTPSAAFIKATSGLIETHVMIRPRAGDFVYSEDEIQLMEKDISMAHEFGAAGVVFGCLTETKEIDIDKNRRLLDLAQSHGLNTTFHRAFDFLFDMENGLNQLVELGAERILTSGGQTSAYNGLNQIMQLITMANGKIQIMAGSGINPSNIKTIKAAGVDAAHFSIRKKQLGMASLNMGNQYDVDIHKLQEIVNSVRDE